MTTAASAPNPPPHWFGARDVACVHPEPLAVGARRLCVSRRPRPDRPEVTALLDVLISPSAFESEDVATPGMVSMRGELTATTIDCTVWTAVMEFGEFAQAIVLDFRGVDRADECGAALVEALHRVVSPAGGRLSVHDATSVVEQVLRFCGIDDQITLCHSVDHDVSLRRQPGTRHRPPTKELTLMPNTWIYQIDLVPLLDERSLDGFDVIATDGSIGTIDEHSTDPNAGYLVVDTGFWIFGKKRLVPAGVVRSIDHAEEKVYLSMTKDEVKSAPDYDESTRSDDDDWLRSSSGNYYDPFAW